MNKFIITVLCSLMLTVTFAQKKKISKPKKSTTTPTEKLIKLSLMLDGKDFNQAPKTSLSGLNFQISPKNNYRVVWEAILMRGEKKIANNFGDSMIGEKLLSLGFVQAMRKPGDILVLNIKKIRLKKGDDVIEVKAEPKKFNLSL